MAKSPLTGCCFPVPATVAPAGMLALSGQLVNRADYPDLYAFAAASGNMAANDGAWVAGKFSPGNGTTTFRLPDARGEFVRGWDNSRGVDVGRTIGSHQTEMIGPHNHPIPAGGAATGAGASTNFWQGPGPSSGMNTSNNTGTENRPRNIAWLWCIFT